MANARLRVRQPDYDELRHILNGIRDWFTGVSAVQLHSEDGWVDSVNLPLWVWDAGTDSRDTYLAKNADTQPRESTRLLSIQHFLNGDGLIKFGTISIERQPNE